MAAGSRIKIIDNYRYYGKPSGFYLIGGFNIMADQTYGHAKYPSDTGLRTTQAHIK